MEETIVSTITNIIKDNPETLKTLYSFTDSWYIILPVSLITVLFSKKISKVIFFILGFISSYVFIIPYLLQFEVIQNLLKEVEYYESIAFLIFSIVIGILTYSIFKSSVQLAGFILGGILGFEISAVILKFYPEIFEKFEFFKNLDQAYVPWIFIIFFGLIISILISKSFDTVVTILTIFIASTIASFFTVYSLEYYFSLKIGENTILKQNVNLSSVELLTILAISLIYITIGIMFNFKKSKK
ncbi:hypothetical protein [Marinitoga litoralis]|jgi:ABC-type Co2+ transport system permease subunit|uniref:hypothetical protein n=1 Tax=Marinitoga litoralis TaxID=570855 RepID=UPI00195F6BE2|nr:hypothetical protein [Marinitoga litoralis]MBM7558769.1 ABC-type Co2+ transport system permease subunit [Marinitoga litoralis]